MMFNQAFLDAMDKVFVAASQMAQTGTMPEMTRDDVRTFGQVCALAVLLLKSVEDGHYERGKK